MPGVAMCPVCSLPMAPGMGHACSNVRKPAKPKKEPKDRFIVNELLAKGVKPESILRAPVGVAFPIPSKWKSRTQGTIFVVDRSIGGEPIVCKGRFPREPWRSSQAMSVEDWNAYLDSGAKQVPWDGD